MAKYQIDAKKQTRFNPSNGTYEPVDPYTSLKPIWGVRIENGHGETDSRAVAIEFADMGYDVTPNPKEDAPAVVAEEADEEPAAKNAKRKK